VGHYPNCERAQSRHCECQMCCGTQHGWKGAVGLARDPDPKNRERLRERVEEAQREAFATKKGSSRRRPKQATYPQKIAGVDSALADIVDWLAQDLSSSSSSVGISQSRQHPLVDTTKPLSEQMTVGAGAERQAQQVDASTLANGPVLDQIEQLGDTLADEVLTEVEKAYGKPIPPEVRVALADHFWCDLLAQLAHAIDAIGELVDSIPDHVIDMIMISREESKRFPLEKFVVKVVVKATWKYLQGLPFFSWFAQVRKFLPVIRILAILMCKAPERHPAVVEYCIDPLEDQLTAETKRRLVGVLRESLPRMAQQVGLPADRPPPAA
jgi:hypothetical protein